VSEIEQICYNGAYAREQGREALFVTERAVFRVADGAIELIEIAPGIDLEQDVLAHMAFRPRLAADLETMDSRPTTDGPDRRPSLRLSGLEVGRSCRR